MFELPPFLPFFIGALFATIAFNRLRSVLMVTMVILSAVHLFYLSEDVSAEFTFLGYQLIPYKVDALSLMFGWIFHVGAFIAVVYALHIRDRVQQVAGMLYAGSGLGAVFAGDLLTLFIFWELLALTSVFLIWARRTRRSYVAGMRYLIIQVLSGLILLVGAIFYVSEKGTLAFEDIGLGSIYGGLIFMAIGIKCAFPLVHNWITDAYPEATPTGTVFLSVFTTKVAVYALARGYAGEELLVYIGAVMTCFPIFFAVIENDLRRVLAYSLVNQVGFMVCGIGIGTALAINGAVSHAFNDVVFKALLFMSMGAVLHMTGKINASELGGLYKTMPKTAILCIIGAASISAFPLFSGYVSKSMVMSAALENDYDIIWLMLLFASAGVFHHAGIKIPYFAFFGHDSGLRASDPPANMLAAMFIAAGLCIGVGIYPEALYSLLPYDTGYNPYDATHVLAQMQLLFFSALAFVWLNLKGMYPPELKSTNLDVDWLYRRLFPAIVGRFFAMVWKVDGVIREVFLRKFDLALGFLSRKQDGQGHLSSSARPAGSMVMWVATLMVVYLFLSYTT